MGKRKRTKSRRRNRPAFEKARDALFATKKLYKDYLDKEIALNQKKLQIKDECQKHVQWESNFNEKLQHSKEFIEFERAGKVVQPHLDAIEVWEHGPLVHKLRQLRQGT